MSWFDYQMFFFILIAIYGRVGKLLQKPWFGYSLLFFLCG